MSRIRHRQDVRSGHIRLQHMAGCEDIAAVSAEYFDATLYFGAHFFGCACWQQVLGADAAVQADTVAEVVFERFRFHAFCGGLERIEDVHTDFNQFFDKRTDGAAGVKEEFDVVAVREVSDLF